jgi:type I restriction enzyme M protein
VADGRRAARQFSKRAEAQRDDGEPFEEKMKRLAATLEQQFAEAAKLELKMRADPRPLGVDLSRR